ncbi:MAG TPA: lipid-A-disaccharide synthase N-terminal domain-containing protein [Thermoanaerobaculia bacterium]|nr:lipid-A-disaccharide synthase N-terminal domain-containing protein [Thermoanaerobaculia bacterium]
MPVDKLWLAVGFLGQAVFSARFIVQWIASERRRQSVIPLSFWFLSVGGAMILLTYAIHRRDPVFIAGQAAGILVYLRNLWLILRQRKA